MQSICLCTSSLLTLALLLLDGLFNYPKGDESRPKMAKDDEDRCESVKEAVIAGQ